MKNEISVLHLAVLASYKRAQELTCKYSGCLVEEEKSWNRWGEQFGISSAILKSIWRKWNKTKGRITRKI